MASGQTAGTLGCSRCGARFEALPSSPAAYCPYCGYQQVVAPEVGAQLHQYQSDVAREAHRAEDAYRQAAAWQHLAEQHAPKRHGVVYLPLAVASFGTMFIVLGGVLAFQSGFLSREQADLMGPLTGLLSVLGFGGFLLAYSAVKRPQPVDVRVDAVRTACSNCGAPAELAAGQSSRACRCCRGVLIASQAVMRKGLVQAAEARRRALLEQQVQQRTAMVNLQSVQAFVPIIQALSLVGPCLFVLVSLLRYTYRVSTGAEVDEGELPWLWAAFSLAVCGLVAWLAWMRSRSARRSDAVGALSRSIGGEWRTGLGAVVEWLNRFWPCEYDAKYLPESRVESVVTHLGSFPLLVHWKQPTARSDAHFVHVLVALELPPDVAPPPSLKSVAAARSALAACRERGFVFHLTESGLLGIAESEFLANIARTPATLGQVSLLAAPLLSIAQALDAVPARAAG